MVDERYTTINTAWKRYIKNSGMTERRENERKKITSVFLLWLFLGDVLHEEGENWTRATAG